jgi:3-dehydroquinate dehydratase-2
VFYILNGPNLNCLGFREVDIYGAVTLSQINAACTEFAKGLKHEIDFRQTNSEGELIDWIQEAGQAGKGLIINAGALAHTSIALYDALRMLSIPSIEVHLTNVYKREAFRHHSYVAGAVTATIAGMGPAGYNLAIKALAYLLEVNNNITAS